MSVQDHQQQPSSIITQVSPESGGAGAHPADILAPQQQDLDSIIRLDLRGVIFEITRNELMRLPESILLGISNGLMVDGYMMASLAEVDVASVSFSPECLQYTLDMFRQVASEVSPIPTPDYADSDSPEDSDLAAEAFTQTGMALKKSRRAIIVLREDLDYYCIPIDRTVSEQEMATIKKNCGEAIVNQKKIFTGLRKGDQPGSAEKHLIDMLCSSGFSIEDEWGFRASEPNKTVISSLSLTRLLTQDQQPQSTSTGADSSAGMEEDADPVAAQEALLPHKLLLFWRKPARKCWWDNMVLHDIEDAGGPVRVHIRRVWTLELSIVR